MIGLFVMGIDIYFMPENLSPEEQGAVLGRTVKIMLIALFIDWGVKYFKKTKNKVIVN